MNELLEVIVALDQEVDRTLDQLLDEEGEHDETRNRLTMLQRELYLRKCAAYRLLGEDLRRWQRA